MLYWRNLTEWVFLGHIKIVCGNKYFVDFIICGTQMMKIEASVENETYSKLFYVSPFQKTTPNFEDIVKDNPVNEGNCNAVTVMEGKVDADYVRVYINETEFGNSPVLNGRFFIVPSSFPVKNGSAVMTMKFFKANKTYQKQINVKCSETSTVKIIQQNYTLHLQTGWNLISVPLMPYNTSLSEVFELINGKYTDVYTFNDNWIYKAYAYDHWFGSLNEIEPRKGYWVNMKENADLEIEGNAIENMVVQLHSSWNLIG